MVEVTEATRPDQFDTVRDLCWEYREFLRALGPQFHEIIETFYPVDLYSRLMNTLEINHARPNGSVKLALHDGAPVGCGMSQMLLPGVSEIKRVFVRETARGLGAGRALMNALVSQIRADGFTRIVMDTGHPLTASQGLYLSMGFPVEWPQSAGSRDHARYAFVFRDGSLAAVWSATGSSDRRQTAINGQSLPGHKGVFRRAGPEHGLHDFFGLGNAAHGDA